MDCLDRTNITQQMISLCCLKDHVPGLADSHEKWGESFIFLWAMNGDFISQIYAGTESVLTKITLKGHQSTKDKIEQKMLSLKRWYI